MKVRKYLLICIAAISLNALTSCGGGSTQSDPLDPENPENPEPPAYFNPIEGEWFDNDIKSLKFIFTKDFQWQKSYFEDGKWSYPQYFRTYKMINEESFIANKMTFKFTITKEKNKDILTLYYYNEVTTYYKIN